LSLWLAARAGGHGLQALIPNLHMRFGNPALLVEGISK